MYMKIVRFMIERRFLSLVLLYVNVSVTVSAAEYVVFALKEFLTQNFKVSFTVSKLHQVPDLHSSYRNLTLFV